MKEKWPTVYNKNIKLYYCHNCNHGFLNPYFSKDELNNFYKNEYRKIFVFNIPFKKTVKSVKQMMEDTGQLNESTLRANMIIQKDDNKLNVIDIGSGTGMFLNCCYNINQNLKLYGIEPDDDHKYLSSNSDKFLIFNNLDEVKKLNVIFDKVTIFHTFERVIFPLEEFPYLPQECPILFLTFFFFLHQKLFFLGPLLGYLLNL